MDPQMVSIPRGFADDLLKYFYTQLPMEQGEIAVNALRQAIQNATPVQNTD